MSRIAKLMMTGVLGLAFMAPIASAQRGRVFVGGYFGPAYYGPAYYGYGPGWYGYGWGPGWGWGPYGYSYMSGPPSGSIKFETKAANVPNVKAAGVYVDGGYAGTVDQLKTFKLHPGTHNIELRSTDGHTFYQEKVNIVAGKTLKITP